MPLQIVDLTKYDGRVSGRSNVAGIRCDRVNSGGFIAPVTCSDCCIATSRLIASRAV
jgi:hypothetical protein